MYEDKTQGSITVFVFELPMKLDVHIHTEPTFNSSTKCMGSPVIINDRTPDCHPVFLAWRHE